MFNIPLPVLFIIIIMVVLLCVHIVSILSDRRGVYSVMIGDPRAVQIGGIQNTDEAVQEGRYDFADPDINQQNFPAPIGAPVRDVRFQIIRFSDPVSTRTVFRELRRNHLLRPTIEIATGVSKEYYGMQIPHTIMFLHKPWRRKGHEQVVIALDSTPRNRRMFLTPITPIRERTWDNTCGFVGICPEHTPDSAIVIMQEEIPPIVYA